MQDKRVHGGATIGSLVQDPQLEKLEKMKEVIADDMNVDVTKVASSFVNSAGGTNFGFNQFGGPSNFPVGEGRVHGGSHFIKVSSVLSTSSSKGIVDGDPSEQMKPYIIPQNWM